jgi:hypothetical protein
MSAMRELPRQSVEHPDRAVRSEFVEPILYLAARLAARHPVRPAPEHPMVERLAELAGQRGFQERSSFRELSEASACARLVPERCRKGALVVLALVHKTDTDGGEAARAEFTRLRERLGLHAIAVPAGIEEHLALALEYLRD